MYVFVWYIYLHTVPDEVVSILMDIYEGSSFQVQTAGGLTGEIPQDRGVKQSCPLSPLLFNLATPSWNSSILLTGILLVGGTRGQGPDVCRRSGHCRLFRGGHHYNVGQVGRVFQLGQAPIQCGKVRVTIHNLSEW